MKNSIIILIFIFVIIFLSFCKNKEQADKIKIFEHLNESVEPFFEIDPLNQEDNNKKVIENNNSKKDIEPDVRDELDFENIDGIKYVNGTWVPYEEFLLSTYLVNEVYSWGVGKSIPNTSLEIDLKKKEILMSGYGLYYINNIYKNEINNICIVLFYVNDKNRKSPLIMELRFVNKDKVFFIFPAVGSDRNYSADEPWMWYRLSGPEL